MKRKFLIIIIFNFIYISLNAQLPPKPKQCYITVDWIDPITKIIVSTNKDTIREVCVKFIDLNNIILSLSNIDYKVRFNTVEFIEVNENGIETYKGITEKINGNKYEIVFVTGKEGIYRVALVLVHFVKDRSGKEFILQYKHR